MSLISEKQNLLAGLRTSSLVRDDSGKHRVYRDEEEREYHSVTSILKTYCSCGTESSINEMG